MCGKADRYKAAKCVRELLSDGQTSPKSRGEKSVRRVCPQGRIQSPNAGFCENRCGKTQIREGGFHKGRIRSEKAHGQNKKRSAVCPGENIA